MLAQNFKSAAELRLSDAEHAALIVVLGMLERDEIPAAHHQLTLSISQRKRFNPTGFNMLAFYAKADCGTACCICGWAEHVGNLPIGSLIMKRLGNSALMRLFEPPGRVESITPSQAAIALRNYLTQGDPRWHEALSFTENPAGHVTIRD